MQFIAAMAMGLLVGCPTAQAEKFSFQTAFDHFEFSTPANANAASASTATFEGKTVDVSSFSEGLTALTSKLGNECPTNPTGKPDITVKVDAQMKSVYIKQGVVTDGKSCLMVAGDGLYYLPLHRDFLNGPKTESIELKAPLKIFRQGIKILSLKKEGKVWVNENSEQLLDWDFLERFENSLKDFSVRLRVQEDISKDKIKMIVQSGTQSYEFYKITERMWAVKKPAAKWLVASDDWSNWYDFEPKMLEDRYAGQIEFIRDSSKDLESRLSALKKLETSWSPNLRELYHKLLLRDDEPVEVQAIALKRLKSKPALETAGVMVKYLESSSQEELKREASVILRLQNPKGPKYNPNASDNEKQKVRDFWRTWWSKQSAFN